MQIGTIAASPLRSNTGRRSARDLSRRVRTAAVVLLLASCAAVAQAQEPPEWPTERPPKPLPAREMNFPPYEIRTLPNGLQVMAVLHHEQPAVTLRLLVRAGAAQDEMGRNGVATLTAALLDQGTVKRGAREIADTIDTIGGVLGTGAGSDLSFVSMVVMKDAFDFGMNLMSEVVRQPAFATEEIERQRQQIVPGLKVKYEDPDYIASVVFDRLVYGFHPYGMPSSGTPETISRLTRDDLVRFHETWYVPNNAILAIVGDVTAAEAFAVAEKAFGTWERRDIPKAQPSDVPAPTRRVIVVDKPGAVQTEVRVGHVGIPRKHPDYMPLNLAIKILGGEGGNRLFRVLRSDRGLTYGASADMETLKFSGGIVAETDTRSEASAEVLRLIVDEFWSLQRERVGERELADAKAYLAGNFPLTVETPDAIALQVLNAVFYGLDLEELETFRERVNAVTVDDIQRVARAYLRPDRLSIVLVGDASKFVSELRGAGFGQYERVALAELDLASADFRRTGVRPAAFAPVPGRGDVSAEDRKRGREIIDRVVQAKGGVERLRAIRTVTVAAMTTLQTPGGPQIASTTTYIEYPERYRIDVKLPQGDLVQAYADGRAWMKNQSGTADAPEEVREDFRQSVRRDVIPLLLGATSGALHVRALPDGSDPGGRGQHVVEVWGDQLAPVTLFIDPTTWLVTRQTYSTPGPSGGVPTEEVFSDYKSVDGIQVAFTAQLRRGGQTVIERSVTSFRFNIPLDPALFAR